MRALCVLLCYCITCCATGVLLCCLLLCSMMFSIYVRYVLFKSYVQYVLFNVSYVRKNKQSPHAATKSDTIYIPMHRSIKWFIFDVVWNELWFKIWLILIIYYLFEVLVLMFVLGYIIIMPHKKVCQKFKFLKICPSSHFLRIKRTYVTYFSKIAYSTY